MSNNFVIEDECTYFKDLGIKSVCLNIDKKKFLELNNSLKKIDDDYSDLGYEKFICEEKISIYNETKKIKYIYIFKDESLVSYSFEFMGNRELFKKLSKKLNNSVPELIKNDYDKIRYNVLIKKKLLHFSIVNKYGINQYIVGGEKLRQ